MIVAEGLGLVIGPQRILRDVSLSIEAGQVVGVVGPSGSGKSSLLYCLAGLLRPTEGRVSFAGRELGSCSLEELASLRRERMGFVFQSAELVPELTLRQNVELPLQLTGMGRRERRSRTVEMLERLGLASRADARPDQVSGGEAQRAAVARAIVHRPAVIFADEPTGALDTENGRTVLSSLIELARVDGATVAMVTHVPGLAAATDRVIRMQDGALSVR